MIFNIVGFIIGLMILVAGIYYLMKEKEDRDSRKIYGITIFSWYSNYHFYFCKNDNANVVIGKLNCKRLTLYNPVLGTNLLT